MLATLLASALAIFMALVWIGACPLPLCLAWGVWVWWSGFGQPKAIEDTDALIAECEALLKDTRTLQANASR